MGVIDGTSTVRIDRDVDHDDGWAAVDAAAQSTAPADGVIET
jgi:hypothetical protein